MKTMINDLDALIKYRDILKAKADALNNYYNRTVTLLGDVAEKWKDTKFDEFKTGIIPDANRLKTASNDLSNISSGPITEVAELLKEYTDL